MAKPTPSNPAFESTSPDSGPAPRLLAGLAPTGCIRSPGTGCSSEPVVLIAFHGVPVRRAGAETSRSSSLRSTKPSLARLCSKRHVVPSLALVDAGFVASSSQGRLPSPSSHRTVLVLITYGSSGRGVVTPLAGRFTTPRYPKASFASGRVLEPRSLETCPAAK